VRRKKLEGTAAPRLWVAPAPVFRARPVWSPRAAPTEAVRPVRCSRRVAPWGRSTPKCGARMARPAARATRERMIAPQARNEAREIDPTRRQEIRESSHRRPVRAETPDARRIERAQASARAGGQGRGPGIFLEAESGRFPRSARGPQPRKGQGESSPSKSSSRAKDK